MYTNKGGGGGGEMKLYLIMLRSRYFDVIEL